VTAKKRSQIPESAIAAARQRAKETRSKLADKPSPSELLTPQEQADSAPFYFVLREYIRQLKEAREVAGLTLADISVRTGMAVEYLSRLETGAQTNPTWKTLGSYAKAVDCRPELVLEVSVPQAEMPSADISPASATNAHLAKPNGITMEPAKAIAKSTRKASPEANSAKEQYRLNATTEPPVFLQVEELVA
jgi:transcriptional regulator with XRE-family HTH domain